MIEDIIGWGLLLGLLCWFFVETNDEIKKMIDKMENDND